MSRFKVLRANPRRTLAAMATLLIAVGVTAASGATFTAQSANPSNTFSSGTLTMTNTKNGAAILTASNMKPGGPTAVRRGRHQEHRHRSPARITLGKTALTDSDTANPMAGKLNLVVTDCGADLICAHRHRRRHQRLHRHPRRHGTRHLARAPAPPARSTATSSPSRSTRRPTTPTRARPPRDVHLGRLLGVLDGSSTNRLICHARPSCRPRSRCAARHGGLAAWGSAYRSQPPRLGAVRHRQRLHDRHVRPRVARARRGGPDHVAARRRRDHLQAAAGRRAPRAS